MSSTRETCVREQGEQQGKTYKRPVFYLAAPVLDAGCSRTIGCWHLEREFSRTYRQPVYEKLYCESSPPFLFQF